MDQARRKQLILTSDACSNMIVGVRQLRLSVLDLFITLADNGPDPNRNLQPQQENLSSSSGSKLCYQQTLSNLATSHSLCTSSIPPLRIQKQQEQQQQVELIQYVTQKISSITSSIRQLDQDIMILMQNNNLISTGESVHLGMDCSLDKHNLYMDLCESYKNYSKLLDYSAQCHGLLHQQSLKRVHKRFDASSSSSSSQQPIGGAQRVESIVATFNPYIYKICLSRSSIQTMLDNYLKMNEYIEGSYTQPFGVSTGVFQMSVNRVLKAILVMRGIVIDAVIVKAYHESFASKSSSSCIKAANCSLTEMNSSPFVGPDEDIDLWSESKYAVFRKLTHHANGAVLHFQHPAYPEIAVRSFLAWFNSHWDLFAATCSRCNSRLRKFMPPICRDFSVGFPPHHDSCK